VANTEREIEMARDILPKKKIGVLAPRAIVEYGPYEFYNLAPKGILLTVVPLGIKQFTREGVEEVFKDIDTQLEQLILRKVDAISQDGVPLQCLVGVEAHDARLDYIRTKTGVPVSSGVVGAIEAAKRLGIGRIAFGNKFTDSVNNELARFFTRAGIDVTGYHSWGEGRGSTYGNDIKKVSHADLVKIGYEVGRRTFEENPTADGIYMPGGSWSLNQVVIDLEAEFGKPVLAHRHVAVWDMVRLVGMWKPKKGYGRLLGSA